MVRMFVRHKVGDYTVWRREYEAFQADRQRRGVIGQGIFRSLNDTNDVTVWLDFQTREQAESFATSDHLQNAMLAAGVIGSLSVWLVSDVT